MPPEPDGSETILVVEPDASLRVALSRVLAARGYTIETVADPAAALLPVTGAESPDLVIVGLGPESPEVRRLLRAVPRKTAVLCVYAENPATILRRPVDRAPVPVLPRPCSTDELTRTVRALLDARPQD